MEAHAGTIGIGSGAAIKPRRRRLAELRAAIAGRRLRRAERAHSLRASGPAIHPVAGSEHTHLIRRPRGF